MKKTLLFLLFSLIIFSATARVFSIRATLNGANVVPANASAAMGTLTGTFDDVSNLVTWSISSNVSNISSYGFHQGSAGTNNTAFSFQPTNVNPFSGSSSSWTSGIIADLLAGNVYVDIISSSSPSGEIRGQIIIGMEIFNNTARNAFLGIGGYSYSQTTFHNGVQANPYIVSGPSPQNDFSYAVSAVGGITNRAGYITATNTNTPLTIQFNGNNIRKFGCSTDGINIAVTATTSDVIRLTATTNLGAVASQTSVNGSRFVGFSVTNENEYLISVTVQFNSTPSPAAFLSMQNIILGDNTPQNAALNFDGVNEYVETNANVGNFTTNQDFTVTCWIKPNTTQTTQSGQNPDENDIISKWAGLGAGVNNNYPFVIRYLNQNRTNINERGRIRVGQWDGINFPIITSTTAVNDGRWHHVAFVKTGTLLKLYIDGVQEGGDVTDNASSATTNSTPLQFGRRGNNESYFKGEIDEVRIWNVGKTAIQIDDEKFCKTPLSANLVAFYNFNNGVPHINNALISQVNEASNSANNGTLNNFAKTGDASNFVTGQVKYVNIEAGDGNYSGSSWANGFLNLQDALSNNTCNDLFDVYVAKSNAAYKPSTTGDVNATFNIPSGMRIYGGFAGTEKSINQRNLALIHSTNKTTLSGDLNGNDTQFVFTTNRSDNSNYPVNINGNNVVFDGFTVSGSNDGGSGIRIDGTNATIKNIRGIDNGRGLYISGDNATIANCSIMGNNYNGIYIINSTVSIKESLIANNGFAGIYIDVSDGTRQTTITNSTIASNTNYGIYFFTSDGTSTNTLKNTLIYGNALSGIISTGAGITDTITYSLVQGVTTGTGNLNGNTVNPQFVSPLASGFGSLTANPNNFGDYRLKWCSLAINAGNNTGISPLDLDRKPRNFNTTADIGAYEFLGNMPSQVAISNITGTIDSPTYAGGAIQTISSDAKILAPAGAIDFKAPNAIILNPGFEARGVGQYFKAEIGANVGCVNN